MEVAIEEEEGGREEEEDGARTGRFVQSMQLTQSL